MANLSPVGAALQLSDINQLLTDAGLQSDVGTPFASLARHQYGYASFDPINSLDPLGLAPPSDEAKKFFKLGAKANKAGNPLGRQFCKSGLEVCLKDAADDGPDAKRCKELFTCAEPPFFLPPSSCPNVSGTLDDLRNRLRQNQSNQ
jgi:hypothetical protein